MREIRFRVWDKQEKEMLFEGFHVFGEVAIFKAIGSHAYKTKGDKTSLERYNDFELMQFTGLKDRHGKEIYEGDICKQSSDGLHFENVEILFNDGCYRARGLHFTQLSSGVSQWFEIIGNIYENKNILISS
jgi:uncharacterized phage protein (TIGR01671 family)